LIADSYDFRLSIANFQFRKGQLAIGTWQSEIGNPNRGSAIDNWQSAIGNSNTPFRGIEW
jgi:hypothetical protein